ncbi:MAG TPA: hypothetical protein VL135_03670, partial [Terracidiphilus sp.]|nr:hypothetical protein [Terracidiphilus sp.]
MPKAAGICGLRCSIFLSASLILASAAALSQQTSLPVSSDGNPTAGGAVEPISVDLVVHDKNRKPYANLKPEDLQVLDNDTPVRLTDLRRVTADGSTEHVVTFVSDRFGGALGKNEQTIATRILKDLPPKGYSFAVLDLVPRLRLIQGFTNDRNAIKDAIRVVTETPKKDKNPVIELTASNAVYQKALPESDDPSSIVAKKAEKDLISIVRTGADVDGTHYDALTRVRYKTLLDAQQASRQVQQDRHTLPSLAALMALVRSQEKI